MPRKSDATGQAMKPRDRPRFDVDTLREIAGDKVFARGEDYHRAGHVRIVALERGRVLAEVAGTENYRTLLNGGGGMPIGGECSCRAFEDWGFCKHMVAVALAANATKDDPSDSPLQRIRAHLTGQSVEALVELIMGLVERDSALFRKLDLAAAATHEDDKTIEARLRKAIDAATRTGGFVEYHAAAGWAEGVDLMLDAIGDLAAGRHGGVALKLAERALDRLEKATGEIDDSDGHCGALLERARDIHLAAARAARPEPVAFARSLAARELKAEYGTFDGAAPLYADVLGAEGLAEFRRIAAEAWEKLPARRGRQQREYSGDYDRLARILDFFAEQDGDVEARIALRAKDLSGPWGYLKLAEFCQSQGRTDEALRQAEEGLWLFEDDRPDERLVFCVADLLVEAGRAGDAEAQLWRAFERAPSSALYGRLRRLGGEAARDRAIKLLETHARARWPDTVGLLVQILMQDKLFDAAWAAAHAPGASLRLREMLAKESETTHPREALAVYAERVDELANQANNPCYAEAAALVARMAKLQDTAAHARFLGAVRARHGKKRNFMKLLE